MRRRKRERKTKIIRKLTIRIKRRKRRVITTRKRRILAPFRQSSAQSNSFSSSTGSTFCWIPHHRHDHSTFCPPIHDSTCVPDSILGMITQGSPVYRPHHDSALCAVIDALSSLHCSFDLDRQFPVPSLRGDITTRFLSTT
jgi:hypothetical protein